MEGATKKQKTDETMEPVQEAQRVASSGGLANTEGRTSETPVSIPPTITYGLQDTHTTIIPVSGYMSLVNLHWNEPTTIALRLNSMFGTYETGTVANSVAASTNKQIITHRANEAAITAETTTANMNSTFFQFPFTSTTPIRWYTDYWKQYYTYYTVLGCEYEIVYYNPRAGGRSNLVAYTIQTNGTTDATRLPVDTLLGDLYAMKNIKYVNVATRDNGKENPWQIIKGTYKPGSAKRDVSNDGDVKLWTKTDADATPTYKEMLQLMHYMNPMSAGNYASATGHHLQMQIKLKYIVQYKQLNQTAHYPVTGATKVTMAQLPDAISPFV